MVTSVRIAPLLALALAVEAPANAAPDPYAAILNGPATWAEMGEANRTSGGCGTEECAAVRDIARAFMIILRRDVPGTMAHLPQPADPTRAADEALRGDMLTHRSRFGAYCTILTKLASHYSEYFIGHSVIELANRLDDSGGQCTQAVLAALPHTADIYAMIRDARETCRTEGRPECSRDQHR